MPRQKIAVISLVALVAFLLLAFALSQRSGPPTFLPGPTPNGFVTLRDAAGKLQGPSPKKVRDDLGSLIATNREALALMRDALKMEAELPAEYYERGKDAMPDMRKIQDLAWLAELEGRHAELQKDWPQAAEAFMNVLRMGQAVEHGPIISLVFGISIEKLGLNGLNRIAANLKPGDRQRLLGQLAAIDGSGVVMEEVKEREIFFYKSNQRGFSPARRLMLREPLRVAESELVQIRADLKHTIAILEGKVPPPNEPTK